MNLTNTMNYIDYGHKCFTEDFSLISFYLLHYLIPSIYSKGIFFNQSLILPNVLFYNFEES